MPAARDSYAEVGAALRHLVGRAARGSLRAREYRVLLAVIGHTASWSRLADTVSLGQLEDATGLDRRNIRRALGELHGHGLIDYQPGDSPKGERRRVSMVALPAPPDRGSTEPPVPGVQQAPGRPNDRGSTEPQTGGQTGPRPGVHGAPDRGSSEPPFREVPEEVSEKPPEDAPARDQLADTNGHGEGEGRITWAKIIDPLPGSGRKRLELDAPSHRARLRAAFARADQAGCRPVDIKALLDRRSLDDNRLASVIDEDVKHPAAALASRIDAHLGTGSDT